MFFTEMSSYFAKSLATTECRLMIQDGQLNQIGTLNKIEMQHRTAPWAFTMLCFDFTYLCKNM
jgi:hypothetical protein